MLVVLISSVFSDIGVLEFVWCVCVCFLTRPALPEILLHIANRDGGSVGETPHMLENKSPRAI